MRFGKSLALVVFVALLQAAPAAHALCAGFTDVPSGGFCGNVNWIKNRQITLGCTSTTLYCPNDPVTRLAMAAFMNRVGDVLTPLVLSVEDQGLSLNISAPPYNPFYVCQSAEVPAVQYPRTVIAQSSVSYTLASAQDVNFAIATSVDGAAFAPAAATASFAGPGQHQHHFILPQVGSLAAGKRYRFAVVVSRAGFLYNSVGPWRCHLQIHVVNATG